MKQYTLQLPIECRQLIHDLTKQKRATGLSPPEEEILLKFEVFELTALERSDDRSGLSFFGVIL